jgi:hypothetical protein
MLKNIQEGGGEEEEKRKEKQQTTLITQSLTKIVCNIVIC